MSEIITKENERVVRLFGSLDRMLSGIERLVAGHRPTLGGERFLTDKEVSRRLKVSRRTLQDCLYHVRRQGALQRIRNSKDAGKVPPKDLAIAMLILRGGSFLLPM